MRGPRGKRGRTVALVTAAIGLTVIAATIAALGDRIDEEWWLWKLGTAVFAP